MYTRKVAKISSLLVLASFAFNSTFAYAGTSSEDESTVSSMRAGAYTTAAAAAVSTLILAFTGFMRARADSFIGKRTVTKDLELGIAGGTVYDGLASLKGAYYLASLTGALEILTSLSTVASSSDSSDKVKAGAGLSFSTAFTQGALTLTAWIFASYQNKYFTDKNMMPLHYIANLSALLCTGFSLWTAFSL